MGLQAPPHLVGAIAFGVFLLFSIIATALVGSFWWFFNGLEFATRGVGLTGTIVGIFTSVGGLSWLMVEELWAISAMKMILVGACLFVTLFCFIAFIMAAVVSGNGGNATSAVYGATAAFLFFLWIIALGCGFLALKVIDGGVGGLTLPSFGGKSDDEDGGEDKPMEISGPRN